MRPSELVRALAALVPTRRPVYLWGPPGVRQVSLVRQAADALGLDLVDVRATLLDPVDLRGLPRLDGDRPSGARRPSCPEAGRGCCSWTSWPRRPRWSRPPACSSPWTAGSGSTSCPTAGPSSRPRNRAEDRAGTHRLISPAAQPVRPPGPGRSARRTGRPGPSPAGVAPEVRAFLQYRPALLSQFDPAGQPAGLPHPAELAVRLRRPGRAPPTTCCTRWWPGAWGTGRRPSSSGSSRLYRELPDLDAVLARPDTAPVPREPAVLYALVGALVERCRQATRPRCAGFVTYALRLPDEFALLALRDALAVNPTLAGLPAVQRWIAQARGRRACSWPPDPSPFASHPNILETCHGREPSRRRRGRRLLVPGRLVRPAPAPGRASPALGLEPFVPDPRPAPACLRDALDDVLGGPRVLVRPLATRDGFAVVREDRGLAANAYATLLTARVAGRPAGPVVRPVDARAPTGSRDAYRAAARPGPGRPVVGRPGQGRRGPGRDPAAAAAGPSTGCPGPRLDDWAEVGRAVERAAEGRPIAVYVLRHRLDADAVRAVRDAVVTEVQAEADRICERGGRRRPGRAGPGDPEEAGGRPAGRRSSCTRTC